MKFMNDHTDDHHDSVPERWESGYVGGNLRESADLMIDNQVVFWLQDRGLWLYMMTEEYLLEFAKRPVSP